MIKDKVTTEREVNAMTEEHPFIQQIDHIGIYARDPRPLFAFFTETLRLPTAFPYTEYDNYTSGSVALGNCFLEIMRFGQPLQQAVTHNGAEYFILGCLTKKGKLAGTLPELARRQIPHSGMVPFFAPQATDENPIQIWANVYLGQLLGENRWTRLFFALTQRTEPSPSAMQSPLLNKISLWLMQKAFANGMPVLTEYYREREAHRRAISSETLAESRGGLLGVERVGEVVVGVRDRAPWARLLAPLTPNEGSAYRIGPGPALRLLPAAAPGIQTITLHVSSLARAKAALDDGAMDYADGGDRLVLTLPESQGISIQLTPTSGR